MKNKYYTWEEYAPNRFRRWDKEVNLWIVMKIHPCCLIHEQRVYSQGKNFKEAKAGIVRRMEAK